MPIGYTTIRFEGRNIQVKWDVKAQKYWFVVVDVLSYLFDNPHFYWQKIKEQIINDGKSKSDNYITCTYGQETIDIADLKQIVNILQYVPGRVNKKEHLVTWLIYPMPSAIQSEIINYYYYNKNKSESEWGKIVNRANYCGVRNEILIGFVETKIPKIIEQKKREEEEKKRALLLSQNTSTNRLSKSEPQKDDLSSSSQHQQQHSHEQKQSVDQKWSETLGCLLYYLFLAAIIYAGKYVVKFLLSTTSKHPETPFILFGIFLVLSAIIIYCLFNDPIPIAFKNLKLYAESDETTSDDINLPFFDKITNCDYCNRKIPFDYVNCPYCGANRIWTIIKELTALALSDRILTDLERETIVNKAVEGGIPLKEINQYLDEQLKIRLQSYSKSDLRACPHCGAQIPLLSENCIFCGNELEHIENPIAIPSYVISKETDIIRSENNRIEETRHGIKNCPDCGAPFPLVSNICASCGHILHERSENILNIKNLHRNIMMSFNRINSAPHPKVYQLVRYWSIYLLLAISMFTYTVGIFTNSEVGKIGASVGLIGCIVLVIIDLICAKKKSPVLIADEEFQKAKQSYEMYARQIKTIYGNNQEAKKLLKKLSESINQIQKERNIKRRRVYYIMGCLSLMILIAITYFCA